MATCMAMATHMAAWLILVAAQTIFAYAIRPQYTFEIIIARISLTPSSKPVIEK